MTRRGDILERGGLFFFYHPKHGCASACGLEDVAAFHLLMHPRGGAPWRYAAVDLKPLLDHGPEGGWLARIEAVEHGPAALRRRLNEAYPLPAARPCGEGEYAILRHGHHTHLVYTLRRPEAPGEVQAALGIVSHGTPHLSVRNPYLEAREEAGLTPQILLPGYPQELLKAFGDRALHPADPVALLDYPGAELAVGGVPSASAEELGVNPAAGSGARARAELESLLGPAGAPLDPLLAGHWA